VAEGVQLQLREADLGVPHRPLPPPPFGKPTRPWPRSNADVEEQMVHMRAQLLRAEQEKELMRVKLEEEVAEKEKAQKQVRPRQQQRQLRGGESSEPRRPWQLWEASFCAELGAAGHPASSIRARQLTSTAEVSRAGGVRRTLHARKVLTCVRVCRRRVRGLHLPCHYPPGRGCQAHHVWSARRRQ
jgi:hypothetical protein